MNQSLLVSVWCKSFFPFFLFQSYIKSFFFTKKIVDCLIAGGSDYGQLAYFADTGDIILEIDDIQVSGLTSVDIEEIILHRYHSSASPIINTKSSDQNQNNPTQQQQTKSIPKSEQSSPSYHSFRVVSAGLAVGLPLDLREYLSRRYPRGSVDHSLQEVIRENVYQRTIPCTTRPPRPGEQDEVDYKFLTMDQFAQLDRAGLLLESGIYQGYHYGM